MIRPRSELAIFAIVLLLALVACGLSAGAGLVALAVARLVGTTEQWAHFAEYVAAGIVAGVLTACFFALGRMSRRSTDDDGAM